MASEISKRYESASGRYVVDMNAWPLVHILRFGDLPGDQHVAYLAEVYSALDRSTPFAVVVDAIGSTGLAANNRKLETEMWRRNRDRIQKLCVGVAIVGVPKLTLAILTALSWVYTPPVELKLVRNFPSAYEWLAGPLGNHNLALPLSVGELTGRARKTRFSLGIDPDA